ncbi:hypothetical protein ACVOMV_33700 [Mesorhizobium atlanticum]
MPASRRTRRSRTCRTPSRPTRRCSAWTSWRPGDQATMFCNHVAPMLQAEQREAFGQVVFLIFQLAGGVVRLALTQDEAEGRRTINDYRSIIHTQLRLFL